MAFLPCLLCTRKRKLFKINMIYGQTGCSIKEYIVQILGHCEEYLLDDYGVCHVCVDFLDNLLYIKKCLFLIISVGREQNSTKPFSFSHVYGHFIENLQKLNYEESESEIDDDADLLRPEHSSPFEPEIEAQYAYMRNGPPYADREVQIAFRGRQSKVKGRRKQRGHNWTKRKRSRSRSSLTIYSEPIPERSNTTLSATNFSEYKNSNSSDDDEEVERILENRKSDKNDNLPRKFDNEHQEDMLTQKTKKYKCITNCSFDSNSLDNLTDHKKEEHRMLAKYVCYECCGTRTFVSSEDLKLHDDLVHSIFISNCPKCSIELRTKEELQKHLRELHPYSCNYCDMFFVAQETCEKHIHQYHKGVKKIIKKPVQYTIMHQAYKRDDFISDVLKSNDIYTEQVIWRRQRGFLVEKLSTLCLNVIKLYKQETVDIRSLVKASYDSITLRAEGNLGEVDISYRTNENYSHNKINIDGRTNYYITLTNDEIDASFDIKYETSEVVPNIGREVIVYTSE